MIDLVILINLHRSDRTVPGCDIHRDGRTPYYDRASA